MKKLYSLLAVLFVTILFNAQTTVTYTFGSQGFTNGQVISSGTIDAKLSYTAAQNSSGTAPTYYTSGATLRMYANSAAGDGNSFTITPATGYKITSVTVSALTSYTPSVTYSADGAAAQSASLSGTTYSITGLAAISSLMFKNAQTGSTTQLRMTSVTVTYETNTLGVNDVKATKKIMLKNTMVDNTLSFQTKGNATVRVYNTNGQLVKTANVSAQNANVNVANLPKGNYVVTAELDGETVSQKILKK